MKSDLKETVKFYPIVGYEHYFLTDDFRVFSKKINRFISFHKDCRGTSGYYTLHFEKNKRREISLPRLVYSVENRINPNSIQSNFTFTFNDGKPGFGNVIVSERSELIKRVQLIKIDFSSRERELFYKRCHEFSALVLESNTECIYNFINRYKDIIIKHLCKFTTFDRSQILYSDLINDLVIGILKGNYQCPEPVSYLKKCINKRFKK